MFTHREILNSDVIHGINNYMGEIIPDDFKILLSRNRDSDILSESNWDTALKMLGGEGENVRIDRFASWACGWFEYLSIKENTPQFKIAEKIEADLKDYPVLNDDDFSERENAEAQRIWKECFDKKERIQYIRENKDQFDFTSFKELMDVINGKYFIGYNNELIG